MTHDPRAASILRVDHAGELGAINIYRAQILVVAASTEGVIRLGMRL